MGGGGGGGFLVLVDKDEVVEASSNSSLTCTLEALLLLLLLPPPPSSAVLLLLPVVVRSLGLFCEVGVSQELESELTELDEVACCVLNLRLFARRPSWGDLRPMSESMGRSLGGFRGVAEGEAAPPGEVTERFSGEKEVSGRVSPGSGGRVEEEFEMGGQRSDVLGVVNTGVISMSSAASPFSRGDLEAVAAAAPDWCAAAGAGGSEDDTPQRRGRAGKPRGDISILEMPADSGKNLGVVSISSDDVDDLGDDPDGLFPEAETPPGLGGDPDDDAPDAVPVLLPPTPPLPRSSPVILAEAVCSMDSIDRGRAPVTTSGVAADLCSST